MRQPLSWSSGDDDIFDMFPSSPKKNETDSSFQIYYTYIIKASSNQKGQIAIHIVYFLITIYLIATFYV